MRTHARQPTPTGDFSTIKARIHVVRGERVILDADLAGLYGVPIVRAFIRMRSAMTDTRELARKRADLEKDLTSRLDSHETAITEFMRRLMQLLDPPPAPEPPPKELGFHTSTGATRNEPMKGPEPR